MRKGLFNLNGSTTKVREDVDDTLAFEGFDEDIIVFPKLVRSKSRNENFEINDDSGIGQSNYRNAARGILVVGLREGMRDLRWWWR